MKGIKIFAVVTAVSWITVILLSFIGNVAEKSGLIPDAAARGGFVVLVKIIFFTLFLITAFSIAPLLVRAFIILAKHIMPETHFLKKLEIYEFYAVCAIWLIWLTGLAIALPVVIAECFFCSE